MPDVIVSQDIDTFMRAADAASALRTLNGLSTNDSLTALASTSANAVPRYQVLAGPSSPLISSAPASFRALTITDVPSSILYEVNSVPGPHTATSTPCLVSVDGANRTVLNYSTSAYLALLGIGPTSVTKANIAANTLTVSGNLITPRVLISNNSTAVAVTSGSISISDGSLVFPTGSISYAAQNIYPDRIYTTNLQVTDNLYVKNYFENLTPLSSKYAPYIAYTSINTLSGSLPTAYTSNTQGVFTIEDLDGAITNISLANLGTTNTPSFSNINISNTLTAARIVTNTLSTNEITTNTLTATRTVTNTLSTNEITTNALTAARIVTNTLSTNEITTNTLTAARVNTNTLSTNEIVTNSLTANEVITNVAPATVSANKTFVYPADNSKIFNFNTSSGVISAIFPSSLPNGFNVGITNTGTNSVYISSTQVNNLCATSNKNNTQFSGIYIYKTGNVLYGVGRFN